jgi:2-polyprenyl-6-methoxyphenol hydroxylase-like FAD-dependent oxidoreductase
VAGAGIGGLTAAAALAARGWQVTVYEQAPALEPVGAGFGLGPNALRALDTLGVGDAVRKRAAIEGAGGLRRPDGRWLVRGDTQAVAARFGDPVLVVHRAELTGLLAGLLPAGALRTATRVVDVDPGDPADPDRRARVRTEPAGGDGTEEAADLVVAADGLRSALRRRLFPGHPGPVYAGYTAWRMVVPEPDLEVDPCETWGRGARFGIAPLADGRVYCYATANTPPGQRYDDDRAELARRFGSWHDPIPALLAAAEPGSVLHHDIEELAAPLPAFAVGGVALLGDAAHAMTPNLGQGGCMAIEDAVVLAHLVSGPAGSDVGVPAALARYTEARRGRTLAVARRSRRLGRIGQWSSRPAVAARDALLAVVGRLPAAATARSLEPVLGWRPPG